MGCPRYGIDKWHKLFLPRQLAVIDAFISCLKEVEGLILESAVKSGMPMHLALHKGGNGAVAYSETIVTYLAFILDRCVSRWNTLSIWNSRGDKIEHIFRMQAFQMTWMFAEANPFSSASGGWDGQVEWVTKAIRELPSQSNSIIRQLDAEVQLADPTPTVLFTDPPYYDNVPYSDLADFFHIFLRKTIGHIWPNEFSTVVTPKREELVADHERHGDKETAKTHFESGIRRVLAQARSGADSRFPSLIYYAFRATESEESGTASTGWETFLQGLVDGGWSVIRTWPIRTELASGLKVLKNMLASSIVLVCRPRDLASPIATRGEFVSRLRSELPSELQLLLKQNIAPVDLAQSAIGPGIAIFSSYSRIVDKSGDNMSVRSALILINEILAEILSGEDSDLDPETRFAITWYEQFGNSSGVFGQADVLAKAKNTTVDKVRTAGLVLIQDGKVRLCQITDLNTDWSPLEDSHLTVWEITHYLILRLEKSEMAAANLLRLVGSGLGDSARQLSYRLFQLSEKRSDAESAGKYNMLVTAWPQIQRLAAQGEQAATEKSLF
jgi:putative DNA methylase